MYICHSDTLDLEHAHALFPFLVILPLCNYHNIDGMILAAQGLGRLVAALK